jgi:hypothetical protein
MKVPLKSLAERPTAAREKVCLSSESSFAKLNFPRACPENISLRATPEGISNSVLAVTAAEIPPMSPLGPSSG